MQRIPSFSYNMKVAREGLNYHVRNRGLVRKYGSGYMENAIQEAIGSLRNSRTVKEKAKVESPPKQHNSIGDTIKISSHTHLELIGRVTLADAVNKNMVENLNRATYDYNMIIEGGFWDGNAAYQTGGNVFDFYQATAIPSAVSRGSRITIRDLWIETAKNDAMHFDNAANVFFSIIHIANVGMKAPRNYGIYAHRFNDSVMKNIRPLEGWVGSLYLVAGSSTWMEHLYMNSPMLLSANMAKLSNSLIDIGKDVAAALDFQGGIGCEFNNLHLHIIGNSAAVVTGIKMRWGTATDGLFNNIHASRYSLPEGLGTRRFDYAIEEADAAQDNNTYTNINGRDCTLGALRVLGPNSDYGHIQGNVVIV